MNPVTIAAGIGLGAALSLAGLKLKHDKNKTNQRFKILSNMTTKLLPDNQLLEQWHQIQSLKANLKKNYMLHSTKKKLLAAFHKRENDIFSTLSTRVSNKIKSINTKSINFFENIENIEKDLKNLKGLQFPNINSTRNLTISVFEKRLSNLKINVLAGATVTKTGTLKNAQEYTFQGKKQLVNLTHSLSMKQQLNGNKPSESSSQRLPAKIFTYIHKLTGKIRNGIEGVVVDGVEMVFGRVWGIPVKATVRFVFFMTKGKMKWVWFATSFMISGVEPLYNIFTNDLVKLVRNRNLGPLTTTLVNLFIWKVANAGAHLGDHILTGGVFKAPINEFTENGFTHKFKMETGASNFQLGINTQEALADGLVSKITGGAQTEAPARLKRLMTMQWRVARTALRVAGALKFNNHPALIGTSGDLVQELRNISKTVQKAAGGQGLAETLVLAFAKAMKTASNGGSFEPHMLTRRRNEATIFKNHLLNSAKNANPFGTMPQVTTGNYNVRQPGYHQNKLGIGGIGGAAYMPRYINAPGANLRYINAPFA